MRILHTSDWHLGRMMGEFSMLDQQAQFIDWLLGVVASEHIELVVIAGDIFDRTNPSVEATELWSNTIRRVAALGVSLAAISGNHDEAIRIDAFAEITDLSGLYMRGGYRSAGQITRIELPTGPLQLVMLPYLSPTRASSSLTAAISKNAATNKLTHQRMLQHFTDQARSRLSNECPSVAVAHAFVRGGESSDSERELAIGGADLVDASTFNGFDYVALGHLHRPQLVTANNSMRYSGSPLPYSFSETGAKSVTIVTISSEGVTTEIVEIPIGRRVVTIEAPFDRVMESAAFNDSRASWVRVILTDQLPVLDAHRRVRERFSFLVELRRATIAAGTNGPNRFTSSQARQSRPREVVEAFWADVTNIENDDSLRSIVAGSLVEISQAVAHE